MGKPALGCIVEVKGSLSSDMGKVKIEPKLTPRRPRGRSR